MFIHTLTFLNISKSSPTKTYLAYLIPNLSFIIQSSCTHFSLKMQYMNCASTLLRLSFHFPISLCLCICPCPSLTLSFHYLCFREGIFLLFFYGGVLLFKYMVQVLSSFLLLPLQSALFLAGFLSFRSPCLCTLIPQGSLLISAVIPPNPPSTSSSPAHNCIFFSLFFFLI